MQFTLALSALAALAACSVYATPLVARKALDVYTPRIISPNNSTVWTIGEDGAVVWDISSPPVNITNTVGRVVLQQGCRAGVDEDCTIIGQLAGNFSILDGWVSVPVPDYVTPADNYFIVLFGDSGNRSPTFAIQA